VSCSINLSFIQKNASGVDELRRDEKCFLADTKQISIFINKLMLLKMNHFKSKHKKNSKNLSSSFLIFRVLKKIYFTLVLVQKFCDFAKILALSQSR
jgi:hypothetical protein